MHEIDENNYTKIVESCGDKILILKGERLEKYKELFLERVNKFNSKKL